METLKYKGFIGSIEAELEDDTLYGKVLGLDKGVLITYEGQTLSELKADFINAVDDYIEHCKANGIELHAKAAAMAQAEGISLNAFVKESLMRAVM